LIVYTVEISPNAVKTENKTVPLKSPWSYLVFAQQWQTILSMNFLFWSVL
jgi:hypothetical protein